MWVGGDIVAQGLRSAMSPPELGKAQKEALVAGEAVDDWCGLVLKRGVIRREGQLETANVGDVLAQGQMTARFRVMDPPDFR